MSAIMDMKAKAWSPAVPCKIPDNIVSSEYASQKVFVPSYEKDKRPCIEQLLTNEYQRIWWQEKESWDKRYSRKVATKKLLQRKVVRKKPQTAPVLEIPKKAKKLKKKTREKVAEVEKESSDAGQKTERMKKKKKKETGAPEEELAAVTRSEKAAVTETEKEAVTKTEEARECGKESA